MYDLAHDQGRRGYRPVYRSGATCPGCGGAHWIVGRFSAECGGCGTALPLAPPIAKPVAEIRDPSWANRA